MNNLINVRKENDVLVVSSREVASNFNKQHKNVIQSIENLIAENSALKSMLIETTYTSDRGRDYKEYLLTRDGFTLVVMGFTGAMALDWKLLYISAFNRMEEALKQQTMKELPQTYIEALKALVQSEEDKLALATRVEEQQEVLAIQAPKVDYHDKVLNTGNGMNISVIAKELGMSAKSLNKLLKEKGIQYKGTSQWLLYKKYQDMGLTVTSTILYKGTEHEKTVHHTKWTEKGRKFIHDLVKGDK